MNRQMNGRNNGGNGNVARGAGFAAAKGAGLILLAVVIGVVLLQVADDGGEPTADSSTNGDGETTETTAAGPAEGDDDTSETTAPQGAELTPEQLQIRVYNGGAQAGAAGDMSEALSLAGYTNQPQEATDWPDRNQTGNAVMCREGLDREAASLAVAVGTASGGATAPVEAFPDPGPPDSDAASCVVVVGAAAA